MRHALSAQRKAAVRNRSGKGKTSLCAADLGVFLSVFVNFCMCDEIIPKRNVEIFLSREVDCERAVPVFLYTSLSVLHLNFKISERAAVPIGRNDIASRTGLVIPIPIRQHHSVDGKGDIRSSRRRRLLQHFRNRGSLLVCFFGKDLILNQLFSQGLLAVFLFRVDCAAADDGSVTSQEGRVSSMIASVRQSDFVGKLPCGGHLEVLARGITQRSQDKGDILIGLDGIRAAVGRGSIAIGQAVGVSVANVGTHSVRNIRKGNLPRSGKGFLLFAQQTHQHDDGLVPGGRLVQVKDGRAVGIGASSFEKPQLIQGLRRLGGLITCGSCRRNEGENHNQGKNHAQYSLFHGQLSCFDIDE